MKTLLVLGLLSTLLVVAVLFYCAKQYYIALMGIPPEFVWLRPILGWGMILLIVLGSYPRSSSE